MLRLAALSSTIFLAACAATRTNELLVGDALAGRVSPASTAVVDAPPAAPAVTEIGTARLEPSLEPGLEPSAPLSAPAALEGESLHGSRFTVKAGYYGSSEDALDDGYLLGVSWMKFLSNILALELEVGYLDADGSDQGVDVDVWSVPIMLNGRLNVPIWVLDLYGGLGVGTFYYDAEASGALTGDDDGFLWGGNAFLGATINLADSIALGLEGKYYATEDASDVDTGLDAFALMLTLGFSR